MIPHGIPTNPTSARWHNFASSSGSSRRPFKNASADDTSSAADELSPEPSGTVLRMYRFAGSIGNPAFASSCATPIG